MYELALRGLEIERKELEGRIPKAWLVSGNGATVSEKRMIELAVKGLDIERTELQQRLDHNASKLAVLAAETTSTAHSNGKLPGGRGWASTPEGKRILSLSARRRWRAIRKAGIKGNRLVSLR